MKEYGEKEKRECEYEKRWRFIKKKRSKMDYVIEREEKLWKEYGVTKKELLSKEEEKKCEYEKEIKGGKSEGSKTDKR